MCSHARGRWELHCSIVRRTTTTTTTTATVGATSRIFVAFWHWLLLPLWECSSSGSSTSVCTSTSKALESKVFNFLWQTNPTGVILRIPFIFTSLWAMLRIEREREKKKKNCSGSCVSCNAVKWSRIWEEMGRMTMMWTIGVKDREDRVGGRESKEKARTSRRDGVYVCVRERETLRIYINCPRFLLVYLQHTLCLSFPPTTLLTAISSSHHPSVFSLLWK